MAKLICSTELATTVQEIDRLTYVHIMVESIIAEAIRTNVADKRIVFIYVPDDN